MPEPTPEIDVPDFDRLALTTVWSREDWASAWRLSGGRDWQMIAALVETGVHSPLDAASLLSRPVPSADTEAPS